MDLPLTLHRDEVTTFPQLATVDELLACPHSCFVEVLPHSDDPSDVLFAGSSSRHAGEVPPPDWWADDYAYIGAVHLFKARDALVFPGWGVVVDRDGFALRVTAEEARYSSPDLSALPHAARRDGRLVIDVPDGVERLPGASVVMPHGATMNYGHFVLDALPALALLDQHGLLARFPALLPRLRPWQARHVALLGAPVRFTDQRVIRADEVIYTSGMHHFLHNPNINYRLVRERQIARAEPRPGTGPRLYISRGAGDHRAMASEDRLVRALRRAGFAVVEPGTLGVDDQIALFAAADVVIGAAGAAFANVLYCRPGTLVIEIQPKGMENHWVQPLCLINRLHFAAYFVGAEARDPARPEGGLRYDLDVERFLDFAFSLPPLAGTRDAAPLLRRIGRRLGLPV